MKKILIVIISIVLFCGCFIYKKQPVKENDESITLDTVEIRAKKGALIYREKATKVWEIFNTKIALSFNWKEKTADAKEWISLRPYFYATDTLTLDAKSMRIDTVALLEQNKFISLNYKYENDVLKIYFTKIYQSTDSIELFLKYTAMPYSTPSGGSRAITDDKGLYFINTDSKIKNKPAEIWTQGESESNSHWMITIDKPNTRFTTQVELTIPDTMTSLSNGTLIIQQNEGNGTRTDIWRMDMPIQAYVVMFAIGKFSIIPDTWKGKEVNYYVEPEFAPFARLMFKNTPEMMDCFSKRTGVPYPWNKYDQVVARDYISGAMENTTAALFGEFVNKNEREIADNNNEDVVAHELFHEWFGDYVTCESWSNLTVNESFANYGEQLWRNYKYGKASADELAYNDLDRYLRTSRYSDPQLVRFYYQTHEEMFDGITYNKGGAILHYINTIAGDAGFDKAMKIYLTKNALHSAEAHDWRRALEEATGQDWSRFFNQWYFHAGHPVLNINYIYDDVLQKLKVIVNQTQNDSTFNYILPLKAALVYGNSKTIIDWNIYKKTDTFYFNYKDTQKPVFIPDLDHVLPGEINEKKLPEQWLAQYKQSNDYTSKRLALNAAGDNLSDSVMQIIIDLALRDEINSIRRCAIEAIKATQSNYYQKRWGVKIFELAKNDQANLVKADAIGLLSAWKDTTSITLIKNAVYDSSYAVAGATLATLRKIDSALAYTIAKNLINTNPKAGLESEIWATIGKISANEDITLYENFAEFKIGNNSKYSYFSSLYEYMKNVKSDVSFSKGLNLYVSNIFCFGQKNIRARYGNMLFSIAKNLKDKVKTANKEETEVILKRIDVLRLSLKQLVTDETENSVKESYEKKIKEVFTD